MEKTAPHRSIIISDESLIASTNINTYFSAILDDWDTKPYVMFLRDSPIILNEITNIYSGYMFSMGFNRVWRANSDLISFNSADYNNRNVRVVSGHVYDIYELDMMQ